MLRQVLSFPRAAALTPRAWAGPGEAAGRSGAQDAGHLQSGLTAARGPPGRPLGGPPDARPRPGPPPPRGGQRAVRPR